MAIPHGPELFPNKLFPQRRGIHTRIPCCYSAAAFERAMQATWWTSPPSLRKKERGRELGRLGGGTGRGEAPKTQTACLPGDRILRRGEGSGTGKWSFPRGRARTTAPRRQLRPRRLCWRSPRPPWAVRGGVGRDAGVGVRAPCLGCAWAPQLGCCSPEPEGEASRRAWVRERWPAAGTQLLITGARAVNCWQGLLHVTGDPAGSNPLSTLFSFPPSFLLCHSLCLPSSNVLLFPALFRKESAVKCQR